MSVADDLKATRTCEAILKENGLSPVSRNGTNLKYLCPFHKEKSGSLSVDTEKNLWHCFGCGAEGSVVDMLAAFAGKPAKQYLSELSRQNAPESPRSAYKPITVESAPKGQIVATYPYHDANGAEIYQVVRLEPKSFRQRRMVDGKWTWNMTGVTRALYRLPRVRSSQTVWMVEGEKDVQSLEDLGFVASCNVAGSNGWLDSYSEHLTGKDLVLCGDNDTAGQKLMDEIQATCLKTAKTIRRVKVPDFAKDITEYLEGMAPDEDAHSIIQSMADKADLLYQGESLPLFTMEEMERDYITFLHRSKEACLDLGAWMPSLSGFKLTPGEMMVIMADTGVGKTALLQNIFFANPKLQTLFFELELAKDKIFRRIVQSSVGVSKHYVESRYMTGTPVAWREAQNTGKLLVCPESSLTLAQIDSIIRRSELKAGCPPSVVLLDYIQLVGGTQKDRYARFSEVAEGIKRIAKERSVVIVIASQVGRDAGRAYGELDLNDAKESGSIENSCGVLLGVSRNPDRKEEMCVQVLKATDYGAGMKIFAKFDFATMRITEESTPAS